MSLSLKFLTELEEVLNYLSHLVMSPVSYVRKCNAHCYLFPAATNDVQRAMAVASGPGEIRVDGKFIEDATAEGCFIVLQSEERAPDVFIALPLPDDAGADVSSTINNIPPSTYTMLVYDLEQDGLPNTHLAFKNESNTVTVDDGKSFNSVVIIATSYSITGSKTTQSSKFLRNATMYFSGSEIYIFCSFKDIAGDVSCVLVYREYGNTTITVREFPKNEKTWSISITDSEKYTFAVFGKNGSDIDQRPIDVSISEFKQDVL